MRRITLLSAAAVALTKSAAPAVSGGPVVWHYYENSNAAATCRDVAACSNSSGPCRCFGHFHTVQQCTAACTAASDCSVVTYIDGFCWAANGNPWPPLSNGGSIAACVNDTVPGCTPPPPINGTTILATVNTSAAILRTHALSPAVTLDFWNASMSGVDPAWANATVLSIDLADPLLRALASQLAPGLLRLGGSPEDGVWFDSDGTCVPDSGGGGPSPSYYCSQVHPYVYGCLTPGRWAALLEFANATGLRLVLGLNGCAGRLSNTTAMNTSNAAALIAATVASPHAASLWGFELSNEVVGAWPSGTVTPAAYAADIAAIRAIAAAAFGAVGLPTPQFVGPDVADPGAVTAVLADAAPNGTLAALTYHHYADCTPGAFSFLLEPQCLLILDNWAAMYARIAAPYAPAVAAWAGETAEHVGGGVAGLTDSFYSTLYYAWQLGALPANGVELVARQALAGGHYALLNASTGFAPNPDFALLWLFKALVGGGADAYAVALNASVLDTGVRVFAFSAAPATGAAFTLLALSLNDIGAELDVALAGAGLGGPRTEYHLAGQPGVTGAPVVCNGATQLLPGPDGRMPAWQGLGIAGGPGPLRLRPGPVVFATVGADSD